MRSEIVGAIKMRVYLSGMPELRLGLNDKVNLTQKYIVLRTPRTFLSPKVSLLIVKEYHAIFQI